MTLKTTLTQTVNKYFFWFWSYFQNYMTNLAQIWYTCNSLGSIFCLYILYQPSLLCEALRTIQDGVMFSTTIIYSKSEILNFNQIFYQLNISFLPPIFIVKDFKTVFRFVVTITVAELQRPSWISLSFHTKICYYF